MHTSRTYFVPDPTDYLRLLLSSSGGIDAVARGIRYRECRLARRGKDGWDGWPDMTDAEKAPWIEKAHTSIETSLAEARPAHLVTT